MTREHQQRNAILNALSPADLALLQRWLLMAQDRINSDVLQLTHEFLALMLGVRRAGVTTTLGLLESRGLIHIARRAVTIMDRHGLTECANGLYGQPEAEHARLVPNAHLLSRCCLA